jgi:hypothetical protein
MMTTQATKTKDNSLHIWEKLEVVLEANASYENPYTEVDVWIDLKGPGFEKRVYGFWDGVRTFRVRFLAPSPGDWTWTSGSNQQDEGLNGKQGYFTAIPWTENEKAANPCRRGFLRSTPNGHALMYADGTPCFLLGDTWWATPTFRYAWTEKTEGQPVGPGMGFKDMVQFRKAQGFNCIAIIAAFPAWANDGHPVLIWLDEAEGLGLRDAWQQAGTPSAKDMHNEGGRPFLFPGRIPGYEDVFPDVDRINPRYFHYVDRKIDHLNAEGFTPFIEVARRDLSTAWKQYYDWPASYARYIHYIFSRYQAHHCILSPIHYDWHRMSIPSRDYNEPANWVIERYGPPPFGTLLSANASGSTYLNFDEPQWLTLHQIGNWRDHNAYWHLTEIFNECEPPRPALNGEPYYAGWPDYEGWPDYQGWEKEDFIGGTEEDDGYCRSGMYGSFLSGGLAGHIYGAQGLWGGDIEIAVHAAGGHTMWDALLWKSGAQVQHLRTFALSEGARYQDLEPNAALITPHQNYQTHGQRGWAYCARTPEKDLFMLYFEAGCPPATVRGALANQDYDALWFDPRDGTWIKAGTLRADQTCHISLPPFPTHEDWALKLVLAAAYS